MQSQPGLRRLNEVYNNSFFGNPFTDESCLIQRFLLEVQYSLDNLPLSCLGDLVRLKLYSLTVTTSFLDRELKATKKKSITQTADRRKLIKSQGLMVSLPFLSLNF